MIQGQRDLQEELNRVYAPVGMAVEDVLLTDVTAMIRKKELDLLVKKIEADAQERGMAIEEAYQQNRRAVEEAAESGQREAKLLATRLASIASFPDLQGQVPKPAPQEVPKDKKPEANVSASPVLMATRDQAGGRFAVLSQNETPRYFEILRSWFFVGRDENCHVSLPQGTVSTLHATIARPGSGLAVVFPLERQVNVLRKPLDGTKDLREGRPTFEQ